MFGFNLETNAPIKFQTNIQSLAFFFRFGRRKRKPFFAWTSAGWSEFVLL